MGRAVARELIRWVSSAAAIPGLSHEESGLPCQDAVAIRDAEGLLTLALADGAGSQRHSAAGAARVVKSVCSQIPGLFDEFWRQEPRSIQDRMMEGLIHDLDLLSQQMSVDRSELASTLLFVALKEDRYAAGHLGDGVLGCQREGRAEVLSHPEGGEYAHQTYFVTLPRAASHLRLYRGSLEGISAFALMSDGAGEALYNRQDRRLARAVQRIWEWHDINPPDLVSQALESNMRSLLRQSSRDDCSLGILRRVCLTWEELEARSPAYQRALLECSSIALPNRLRVVRALLNGPEDGITSMSRRCGLSPGAVRRHLWAIRRLFRIGAMQAENARVLEPACSSTSGERSRQTTSLP